VCSLLTSIKELFDLILQLEFNERILWQVRSAAAKAEQDDPLSHQMTAGQNYLQP